VKHIKNFVEDIVIPRKDDFPVTYDLANTLVIEDMIELLEDYIENEKKLSIRHIYGGYILELLETDPIISIFFDKKTLEIDVKINDEYLPILNLNEPQFKNEENNSYFVVNGLVEQLVARLW
jgi:succinate dehydrogenase flavin-adding protein (antitoxin of CptAB toxin-antitoxin module)